MDRQQKILFLVISVVIVAGGITWYVLANKTPKKKAPPAGEPPKIIAPPVATNTAVSGFPIQQGATGNTVLLLQKGLNQYVGINIVEDGIFGSLTAAAVNQSGHSVPVSQSDYNDIIAPPDASNSVFDVSTGAIPQTLSDAEQVNLDPNATSAQISAANVILSNQATYGQTTTPVGY